MGFYQWLQLVHNFHDLNDILAISWQFLAGFVLCFLAVLLYFLPFLEIFKANFCLFFQFTGQSYCINNHIPSNLISPKYSKCQSRHFACLYIYIFMFHPHFACSSWRDHYNDQGDQNWSRFWYRMVSFWESCCIRDIRYMTNDSNFRWIIL